MSPLRLSLLLKLATCLAVVSSAAAQESAPRIGYIYPAGSRQGAELDLVVGGRNLAGVPTAYVSGRGIQTFAFGYGKSMTAAPAIAETVAVRVTIAPDAEPGQRELRLETPAGLTNPLAFWVGQLPEFREKPPKSDTAQTEMNVALPAILNGRILPGEVDRYRFQARKGQRLVFAAAARELVPYIPDAVPGWFQAVLALYDAEGNELAYVDDRHFHPDPVVMYEVPKDGQYVIAIWDALYRGREDFVYRIAAGEVPFIASIFPLGGKVGGATSVELTGWNLPVSRLTPDVRGPGIYPLFVRKRHDVLSQRRLESLLDAELMSRAESVSSTESISNRVPFAADTLPESLEREPNDSPPAAQQVVLPFIVNGRIDRPGDWDIFSFRGRAGDPIVAEVLARRLNSPLDSVLRLTDAAGRQLAINDDHEDKGAGLVTHHADSLLRVALPADATYYLHLGDVQHQGGPEYAYRLRISPPRPDFELRIVPSSINIRGGATVPLVVSALRKDDFSGEITLALQGAPPGFTLSGGRVPEGQEQVRLTLTVPPTPQKEPLGLLLEGRATIQAAEVVRPVVPAEDMMQAFAYRHLVPVNELIVSVSGRVMSNTTVRILSETPVKIPAGGTARVRVGVPPGTFFDQIQVELDEPPEGIVIQSQSPGREGTEIVLQTDRAGVKPGLKGNLIANAYAAKAQEPGREQSQGGRRRIPLGMLPAIPFEIVGQEQ